MEDFFGFEIDARPKAVLLALETERERFWNVPRSTGALLAALVSFFGARNVLEIGTSNGYSGIFLAGALSHSGGRLYTVESHAGRYELGRKNIAEAGLSRWVEHVKGHAPEILGERFGTGEVLFDLMFFDATKVEYGSYLEAALPVLSDKGMIVADNALSHQQDMQPFIDHIQTHPRLKSMLLPLDNGLMFVLKTGDR